MMKIIVTFGYGHAHEINGKIFDKDSVAIVEGETYSECRQKAFDAFGPKFCTDYNITKLEDENFMRWFPKGAIELFHLKNFAELIVKEYDVVLEQSNKRIAELESVLLEVDECAFYWSEYDVPIGLPERIKRVLENSEEH